MQVDSARMYHRLIQAPAFAPYSLSRYHSIGYLDVVVTAMIGVVNNAFHESSYQFNRYTGTDVRRVHSEG